MSDARDTETAWERILHKRLIARDPLASSELYKHYVARLCRQLAQKYPTTEDDDIHDAVIQALFAYIEHPERYDPAKRSLAGYLLMAAEGDLRNLLKRRRLPITFERPEESVELDRLARKRWSEGGDVADAIADEEAAAQIEEQAMAVAQTEEERRVLRLMLAGEQDTAIFAEALGWDVPSSAAQRDYLYKMKDRLTKRLRRLRGGST